MQINARTYSGHLAAPCSKSYGQRLLVLAALSDQTCQIDGLGMNLDTQAMKNALAVLRNKENINHSALVDVGESGFALRTLAFVARHFSASYELTGHGTLRQRTHFATIHLLEQLGLTVAHRDGKLPLQISGSITNTTIEVDGTEGSQYVSGLFLLAAKYPGNWQITIKKLNSRPYFEMTLAALNQFGFVYQQSGETYSFEGAQQLSCASAQVEGDWSSVAAHLVGAAIRGKIELSGLRPFSLQPDKNLLHALEQFGAKYNWNNGDLCLTESKNKTPFDFDITQQPDLFPVLVVLACAAQGKCTLSGIHRLKNKESDRLKAMCEALEIWGIGYQIEEDKIEIHGTGQIKSGKINTYNDHRIVMASCVASLLSENGQTVEGLGAIEKSYPDFITDFLRLTQA